MIWVWFFFTVTQCDISRDLYAPGIGNFIMLSLEESACHCVIIGRSSTLCGSDPDKSELFETEWHIYVRKKCIDVLVKHSIIGSDNGLSPVRHQAIIWTNAGLLSIGPLGTYFSEILSIIHRFSLKECISNCHLQNGSHFVSTSVCLYHKEYMQLSNLLMYYNYLKSIVCLIPGYVLSSSQLEQ